MKTQKLNWCIGLIGAGLGLAFLSASQLGVRDIAADPLVAGRYQIAFDPVGANSLSPTAGPFLLDTATGTVWRNQLYLNGQCQTNIWRRMVKSDKLSGSDYEAHFRTNHTDQTWDALGKLGAGQELGDIDLIRLQEIGLLLDRPSPLTNTATTRPSAGLHSE